MFVNQFFNMKELKFKTNINCGGCIAKVTPYLDEFSELEWSVDTASADKILTVKRNSSDVESIIEVVTKSGFQIERLRKKRFGLF